MRFYSPPPGIVIHIVPESLFTWLRNSLSTCPGIRTTARPLSTRETVAVETPDFFATSSRLIGLHSSLGLQDPERADERPETILLEVTAYFEELSPMKTIGLM